ncbi:MAG: radical SAM protein, partial [Pseudomonadota bacterium]
MQLPADAFSRRRDVDLQAKLERSSREVWKALNGVLTGKEVTRSQATTLFKTSGADKEAVLATADALRSKVNGDHVTFVVNRNINFTNVCYMGCRFCGFAKRKEDERAEWLELADVVARAQEAWDRGATEVCIQGGLHPDMP